MSTELSVTTTANNGAAILGRVINPDDPTLGPEAARSILKLTFPKGDKERVASLLARNQEGQLNEAERAELDEYLRADAFLSVLKTKARLSLNSSMAQSAWAAAKRGSSSTARAKHAAASANSSGVYLMRCHKAR